MHIQRKHRSVCGHLCVGLPGEMVADIPHVWPGVEKGRVPPDNDSNMGTFSVAINQIDSLSFSK